MRRSLEAIGLFALAGLLWVTCSALYGPEPLPARVPTHFDLAGHPNGWGSPAALFLLPAIALVLYCGMTLVARYPSVFNYPVRVTPANRPRLEEITISLLTWIKVEMVCFLPGFRSRRFRSCAIAEAAYLRRSSPLESSRSSSPSPGILQHCFARPERHTES